MNQQVANMNLTQSGRTAKQHHSTTRTNVIIIKDTLFTLTKLVLAGLLAAPMAHASELSDLARSMAPGTFAELKTKNPGCIYMGGRGTVFAFSNGGSWDPVSRQMLQVGAPHGSKMAFIRYQESDNTWYEDKSMPFGSDGWAGAHTYDHLTIDPKGIFYHIYWQDGIAYRYDAPNGKWLEPLPKGTSSYGSLHYFPELDGLLRISRGQVSLFRLGKGATNAWENIKPTVPIEGDYENLAAYCPAGKFVMYGGGSGNPRDLYKIDANLTVTALKPAPWDVRVNTGNMTADPVTGTLLYMNTDGFYAYNADKDNWYFVAKTPLATKEQGVIPISTYGVLAICTHSSTPVILYKFADAPKVMQPAVKATLKAEQETLKAWQPTRVTLHAELPGKQQDATNTGVSFTGSDATIAKVYVNGQVMPVLGGPGGEITVTATRLGEPVASTCLIKVSPVPATAFDYFTDLPWDTSGNGYWGKVAKDLACGDKPTPIILDGTVYAKGASAIAPGFIVCTLGKKYTRFICDVGVAHESARFLVHADDVLKYEGKVLNARSIPERIDLDVTGVEKLKLSIDNGTTWGKSWADGSWANPVLLKAASK